MLVPRQEYSRELKIAAMHEIDSGKGIAEVARMFQVSPKRLETWKGSGGRKVSWRFPATAAAHSQNWMPIGLPSWNARSDSKRWRSSS